MKEEIEKSSKYFTYFGILVGFYEINYYLLVEGNEYSVFDSNIA